MKKLLLCFIMGMHWLPIRINAMESKFTSLDQISEHSAEITNQLFMQAARSTRTVSTGFKAAIFCKNWVDCQICEILSANIIKIYDNCGWLVDTFGDGSPGSQYGIQVWFLHKESLYSQDTLKEAYTEVIRHLKYSWEGCKSQEPAYYLMVKKRALGLYQEKTLIECLAHKLGFENDIKVQEDNTTIYLWMKKDVTGKLFKLFFIM